MTQKEILTRINEVYKGETLQKTIYNANFYINKAIRTDLNGKEHLEYRIFDGNDGGKLLLKKEITDEKQPKLEQFWKSEAKNEESVIFSRIGYYKDIAKPCEY